MADDSHAWGPPEGAEQSLVLLHGLGADHRAFQRFQRLLPASWRTLAVDLLGHGAAEKPAQGYRLEDHARWIAQRLESEPCGLAFPAWFSGHSLGAAVAVAVAATRPDLVAGLVLLDPARLPDSPAADDAALGTRQMVEAKRAGRAALEATVEEKYAGESPALRRWIVDTWEAMAVGQLDDLDTDWSRFVDKVAVPVTVIHGEHRLGATGEGAAARFAKARAVAIPGAGHYLHASHARDVAHHLAAAVEPGLGRRR